MKTKSLWFATAAAVVLTGMTMMTSCSKDDYELPEVIESEVYDEGEAGEVRAEVGTEGTQLSYESWKQPSSGFRDGNRFAFDVQGNV